MDHQLTSSPALSSSRTFLHGTYTQLRNAESVARPETNTLPVSGRGSIAHAFPGRWVG